MKIYYYKIETEKFNVIFLTVQGFFFVMLDNQWICNKKYIMRTELI